MRVGVEDCQGGDIKLSLTHQFLHFYCFAFEQKMMMAEKKIAEAFMS